MASSGRFGSRLGLVASALALDTTVAAGLCNSWAPSRPEPPSAATPTAGPSPPLSLVWIDVTSAAPALFPDVAREITTLLDRMGVRASVRRGDPHAVMTGAELSIILLAGRTPGARLVDGAMGATRRSAGRARAIWVYFAEVTGALGLDPQRSATWPLGGRREVSLALARVSVHELVHALAPWRPHLDGGLMARRMGRALLLSSPIAIDTLTAEAVRAALAGSADASPALAALPVPLEAGPLLP